MSTELAIIEPIQPPDVRRPAKLILLPAWLKERCNSCTGASQPGPDGKHRMVSVLPRSLILGKEQKMLVEQHISALDDILAMTPYEDQRHGELTLATDTKMMMVLPCREAGDFSAE